MSSQLDAMTRRAVNLETALKSVDDRLNKMGRGSAIAALQAQVSSAAVTINRDANTIVRALGRIQGAQRRMGGGGGGTGFGPIRSALAGPNLTSSLLGAAPSVATPRGASASMRAGPFSFPVRPAALVAAAPFVVQGLAGLGATAGAAAGAGVMAAGAGLSTLGALGGTAVTTMVGAKPVAGKVSEAFKGISGFRDEMAAAKSPEERAAATKKMEAALKGIPAPARDAARSLLSLREAYEATFTEGVRGARQFDALNRVIGVAGNTLLPLITEQWERFFPVVDRSITAVEKFLGSARGLREVRSWGQGLPEIATNLADIAGSGVRLMGGLVRGFAPLARWMSGGFARWLGGKADWANSAEGFRRINELSDAAKPILTSAANAAKALGTALMTMLGGPGGRGAAYIFESIARFAPDIAKYMNEAAKHTPVFVDAFARLVRVAADLFGPSGYFRLGLTILDKLTRLIEGHPLLAALIGGGIAGATIGRRFTNPLANLLGGIGGGGGGGFGAARAAKATGGWGAAFRAFAGGGSRIGMAASLGSKLLGPVGVAATVYGAYQGFQAFRGGANSEANMSRILGPDLGTTAQQRAFLNYKPTRHEGLRKEIARWRGDEDRLGAQVKSAAPFSNEQADAKTALDYARGKREELEKELRDLGPKRWELYRRNFRAEKELLAIRQDSRKTMVGLVEEYEKVNRQIDRARAKNQDDNDLVAQKRALVEQIAAQAPSTARYSAMGELEGINEGIAGRGARGSRAGLGRRGLTRALRSTLGRRVERRTMEGDINRAFGLWSPDLAYRARTALAEGDNEALSNLARQSQSTRVMDVVRTRLGRLSRVGTMGEIAGEASEVTAQLKDLGVNIKKLTTTITEEDKKLRREERERKRGEKADLDALARGKPGLAMDPDRGVPMGGPGRGLKPKNKDRASGQKQGDAHAKGIRDTKPEVREAAEEVRGEATKTFESSKGRTEALVAGNRIGRKFADGVWERRDRVQTNAGQLMDSFVAGIESATTKAKTAAKNVIDAALGALDEGVGAGTDAPGTTPRTPPGGGRPNAPAHQARRRRGGRVGRAMQFFAAGGRVGDFIAGRAASTVGSWGGGATLGFASRLGARFGLTVSSGYRDPARNAAAGGVPGSMHTHGSPSNPGAIDMVGSPAAMNAAAAAARAAGVPEVLVHDAGSGMHLHMGFFAGGGRIPGRRARADNVPAMLSPGEFVVTGHGEQLLRQMTGRHDVLEQIERRQRPHFAAGGRAGGAAMKTTRAVEARSARKIEININGNVNVGSRGEYDQFIRRLTSDLEAAVRNLPEQIEMS